MDIKKLQRVIVDGLEDVKGQDIAVFDTEHLSSLFERVIIASGTSNRQTKALASSVRDAVKKAGHRSPRVEGEDNGEWIIVDCGSAVVHLMQPNIREYYHLEEIWGDKPVKMKIDTAPKRLVKAEEPAAPAKKTAAKKAPARKAAAAASPEQPPAKPAKPAASKKAPVRKAAPAAEALATPKPAAKRRAVAVKPAAVAKAAPAKAGVTRTVGTKSASAAAAPARKPAASKSASGVAPSARSAPKSAPAVKTLVVNKPVAKKAPAKPAAKSAPASKAPAKKAPARKTSRSS